MFAAPVRRSPDTDAAPQHVLNLVSSGSGRLPSGARSCRAVPCNTHSRIGLSRSPPLGIATSKCSRFARSIPATGSGQPVSNRSGGHPVGNMASAKPVVPVVVASRRSHNRARAELVRRGIGTDRTRTGLPAQSSVMSCDAAHKKPYGAPGFTSPVSVKMRSE